jgi:Flp pilus assembly protein TadD
VLIELGSVEEAERLVAEAIPRLRARYGDKHRHVADALRVLGLAMLLQGNPGPAEPLLREGVRVLRELPYTDAWRVARTESALGACLVALKRFEDAEPLLLQSYSVLLAARGPGFCETLATRQRLSGLYEAWGKPEQAGEFQQATR